MDKIQHILFLIFAFLCFNSILFSQNNLNVSYSDFNTVPSFLNVCGSEDEVVVRVSLEGGAPETRSNILTTAHFFKGVELLSFNENLSSPDVLLADNSDPNNPVFSIPDLSPNGLTFVDIAFSIRANCGVVDSLDTNDQAQVFDLWETEYDLEGMTNLVENDATSEYRDAFAIPFFTIEIENNNPKAKVSECFSRELTVINSSLDGFVDNLVYENFQGAGISVTEIQINGLPITIEKLVQPGGDTLVTAQIEAAFFQNNASSDGDAFFDPNEILTITEFYCVESCVDFTGSNHNISWGCDDEFCRTSTTIDFVELGEGAANIGFDYGGSLDEEFAGYCVEGQTTITFTNAGIEFDEGFATMIDVETGIGLGGSFTLENGGYTITGIRIAGIDITDFQTLNLLDGNLAFMNDPDGAGGLTDEDGDGFFDDLALNESIEITAFYEFDCSLAYDIDFDTGCTNDFGTGFNGRIIYTDACQDRLTHSENNYVRPSNSNSNTENFTDPDAFAEDIFFVTHEESRSVRFFEKSCNGEELFIIKVALPANVNPIIGQTEFLKNTFSTIPLISDEIQNDTLILTYDASFSNFLNGDYQLKLAFQAACEANFGATEFPLTIEHYCPSCDCAHLWYCGVLDGPQLHGTNPPCPPDLLLNCEKGVQTTAFSVERTSLGFTDQSYSTQIDPEDANLKVGVSCDEVEMRIQNVVGETPISDNLGMVITYDNPDESTSPEQVFTFQDGQVRFLIGNNEFFCDVSTDDLTVIADTSSKRLTFDLSNCLADLEQVLTQGDSVEFIGNFSINKNGPFLTQFRKIPNLRAYGFAIIDGVEEACDNFGENFTIAKNQIAFDFPNNNDFPSGCQNAQLEYRLITVNNGFSDFFPNEFRQASRVDSIIFDYDPAILEAFDNISVEVSIPDHPIFGNSFFPLPSLTEFPDGNYVAAFDTLLQVPSYNTGSSTTFNLRINLTPTCQSNVGSSDQSSLYNFDARIHYIDRFYATLIGDGSCSESIIDSVNSIVSYEEPPSFSLTPVSNTEFILFGDTAEWIVQHCNTSFESDANLTWMAIEDITETITIVSMEDISDPSNPIDLPIEYYGTTGSNAFAFTNGLLRSNGTNSLDEMCNFIKIRAIVNQCENVSFDVRTGWNCGEYAEPDWSPEIYPPCEDIALGLSLTFRDPFLDANIVDQPTTNPSICDTTTITILLRNIDRGAAFDMQTQLILPLQGATMLPESVEFAYPSSADFQLVNAEPNFVGTTLRGKVYQYDDFSNFNDFLNTNGLLGFNTTNPTDSNEIKIRYSFVTDCDFLSGGLSFYNFQGFKGCGDQSNFEAGESLPLIINGTEPDLTKLFQVNFTSQSVLVPNSLSNLEVMVTNLTNTPTEENDFIKLSLPSDLTYVIGSTFAIQPGNWDLGEPEITIQNGFQVLNWKMPEGLVLNEVANFQFQVDTPNYGCDEGNQEVQLMTVSRQQLFCESLAENCEVETITATTGVELTNLPIGSGLGINFENVTSVCFNEDEELVTVSGSIFNNSVELDDEEFNISFFIDANENGIIDDTETTTEIFNITGTVGPNNPLTFEFTLPIEILDLCRIIVRVEAQNTTDCGITELAMPTPILTNAGEDQVFCAIGNETFNTQIGDTNCESVENYNLTWTALPPANEASLSDIKVPTPTITIDHDGIGNDTLFYVLETQRPNCTEATFDTIAIVLAEGIDLESPTPITIFPNESIQLNPNILSGTGPFNIQWNPDPTLSATNILTPTASPEETTDYFLTLANGFGCMDTATFQVQVVTPVVAEVIPEVDTICAEHSLQLQASGGDVYVWMPSANNPPGGMLSFPSGNASPVFSGGISGNTYIIDVIVSLMDFPDFPDTAQVSITIFESPTADAGEDLTICFGEQIQLDGSNSNGTGDFQYQWNPEPLFGQGTATPTVQPGLSTTYSLTIIDENGCAHSDEIIVNVEDCNCDEPIINVINTTFGNCDGANGSAEIILDGDASQLNFQWSPNIGTPNINGNARTDLPAGGYSVIISQNNDPDCQTEVFISIENEDGPEATVQTTPAACNDATGSAILLPADFDYTWNIGGNQNERNDLLPGTYFVTVVDPQNLNCENVLTVIIEDENPLIAEINIITQPNCNENNGTVQLLVSGGSGNYGYSWPSGLDTQMDLTAGIYTVTITDLGTSGCEIPVIFILTDNVPIANVEITDTTNVSCFGGLAGGITFNLNLDNGVAEPLDTLISNGLLEFENNNLPVGNYCIQINDANGCVAGGACFDITQPDQIIVQTSATQDCDNGGMIELTVNGGTPNYEFQWENLPNPTTQNQSNLASGFYKVTVTDINNCELVVDSIFVPACVECEVFEDVTTAFLQAENCSTTGSLCLNITESDLPNKLILDNQNIYQGDFSHCDFSFLGNYNTSTLFGQGNSGPYELINWPGIGNNLNLTFNNLEELTQIMQNLDPMANWALNFPFINGGVESTNYGQMEVLATTFNLTSFIGFNAQFIPSAFAIDLELGSHEIIVIDTILGCRDTVMAEVVCTMPDTLNFEILIGDSLEICFETSELITDFETIYNDCPEGIFVEYEFSQDTTCIEIVGIAIGSESACIVFCDSFNICDTTYININVLPPPCVTDTIVVSQIKEYCLDTMGLNLTGLIESVEIDCPTSPGGHVEYILNDSTNCLIYEGLSIGTDSTCVKICDVNGNCDTLAFCVSVVPGDLVTDTILVIHDTIQYCIDTTNLAGNIVNVTDLCAEDNGDNVQFIIDEETFCITYIGLTEGVDTSCILIEDDLGNIYLTSFIITAIEINAASYCDTLFINDPRTYCIDTTELPGNVSEIFNICEEESTGNVDVFLNFLDYCVQYNGSDLGQDSACVVICDDLGFCDTTYFCFLVEPNFDPPIANPDIDSTNAGTPKVLDIKANDILFGGEPVISIIKPPDMGEVIVNLDCSVTYVPFVPFCDREDNFIYEVCIDGNPSFCDTAIVLIDVLCQELTVFNAISPNGDGFNDYFHIGKIKDFPDNKLQIFNRWNNLVYETTQYSNDKGWPGTWADEKDLPDGTYFYILEWMDDNGVLQIQRGYIEILR